MESLNLLPQWLFPVLTAISAAIIGLISERRDIKRNIPHKAFRLGRSCWSYGNLANFLYLLFRWTPYLLTIGFFLVSLLMIGFFGGTVQNHYISRIDTSERSYVPSSVEVFSTDEHPFITVYGWFPRKDMEIAIKFYKEHGSSDVPIYAVVYDLHAANRGLLWVQVNEGNTLNNDGSYRVGAYLGSTGRFCAIDGQQFQIAIYIPMPKAKLGNGRFAENELPDAIFLSKPQDVRIDRPISFLCPP